MADLEMLRAAGWSVAVHNDYRLHGEPHTFWLFTHPDGRWVKGEGQTDKEALAAAVAQVDSFGYDRWATLDTCPSGGESVWTWRTGWSEPVRKAADGEHWRLRTREGSIVMPTHWLYDRVPMLPNETATHGPAVALMRSYLAAVDALDAHLPRMPGEEYHAEMRRRRKVVADARAALDAVLADPVAGRAGGSPLVAEKAWGDFDAEGGLLQTVPDAVMAEFECEARNHANLWTSGNEAARQAFQAAVSKAWIGGVQSAGCALTQRDVLSNEDLTTERRK